MINEFISIFRDSSNSFDGQENNERVCLLLRRHPFTILTHIGFFIMASFIPVVAGIIFFSYIKALGWLVPFLFVSSLWYLGLWLAIFHALTIYTLNTTIITDRRIVYNNQLRLFNREISELHHHRIQDVTVRTNGFVETFLKFGDVTVQTAASEKQFVFRQVPKPEEVKDAIMQAAASMHSGVKTSIE